MFSKLWHRITHIGFVQKMTGVLHRLLSNIATKYLALTVNSDPYAAKAFAKPGSHRYNIIVCGLSGD